MPKTDTYDDYKTVDPDDREYCKHGHWHGEGCADCDEQINENE